MKLPNKLLAERVSTREHILERDFVLCFVFVCLVTGIEVFLEGGTEIDLFE
jgi:hypothetical protein